MKKWSATKLSTWDDCKRKFYWKYIEGWERAEKPHWLEKGSAWDALLADMDVRSDSPVELVHKHFKNPYDKVDAAVVLLQYHKLPVLSGYFGDHRDNQARVEFTDAAMKWKVTGAVDRVVRKDNMFAILERKTTSDPIEPNSDYWDRIKINTQLRIYFLWAYYMGYTSNSCDIAYEVIRKPGKKVAACFDRQLPIEEYKEKVAKWAADPNKTLAERRWVTLSSNDIEEIENSLDLATHQLEDVMEAIGDDPKGFLAFPQNGGSCKDYGGCEYQSICTRERGFDNNPFFKRAHWAERKKVVQTP